MSETTKNGAFRKKRVYFSQVSNSALRDDSLSLKAKGLYALIQSYITIEDFTLYKTTLKKKCIEGEKAFESTWKELKDAGYLVQHRLQDKTKDENGKATNTFYYEYELLDQADKAYADEIHSKQNRKKQSEKKVSQPNNPKKEGMDENGQEPITPILDGMGNGCDGQGGVYIITDPIDTDLTNTDLNTTEASKDAVAAQQEEVIVRETNIKELSNQQKKKVANWDMTTLVRAIQIYNSLNGLYFKLLEKIYKDGAVNSLVAKKSNSNSFTNIYSHDWDLDELERQADAYMIAQLSN